ncbi:MAG TPA: hypothetical protein DCR14_04590 [Acidimicrobiaceae bacterium]|nr:hypothetical protein [Acidimicrobiaceae bacterium]
MALREVHARKGRTRDARSVARRLEQLPVETAAVPGLMLTDAPTVVPLTRREREIAHLVSLGRSSKEVAEACFVSVRTVDNHLARIYDKLGVRSRGELAEAIRPLLIGELA